MAVNINGISMLASQALADEEFMEWLDNCFHRRGFYSNVHVGITLGIHYSAAEKVESVFRKYSEANLPVANFKYRTLDCALDDLKNCFVESKVPHDELEWINQVNLRVVAYVRHALVLGQDLLAPQQLIYNAVDSSRYKQIPKAEEILMKVPLLSACTFSSSTSSQSPRNDRELRLSLKHFFRNWEAPLIAKKPWIDRYRQAQTAIEPFENSFNWLDVKNSIQIEWALGYMKAHLLYNQSFQLLDLNLKRIATILCFDFWQVPTADKELFLIKMKKAWSVKKFRDKNKGKKSFNFLLDSSMEKKLNELVSRTGKTKNEIIELCVKEAHKNTPKPGKIIAPLHDTAQTTNLDEP